MQGLNSPNNEHEFLTHESERKVKNKHGAIKVGKKNSK